MSGSFSKLQVKHSGLKTVQENIIVKAIDSWKVPH